MSFKVPHDETLEIRPLAERDIAEVMRLKDAAGWNQTEADWRRLLRLEPRGCLVGDNGGRLVATTTTTSYEQTLAWIGMVLVDPSFRRRGIATALVRAALDRLETEGVEAVKLDATPEGAPVYEGLGFEAELLIERWSRAGSTQASGSGSFNNCAANQLGAQVLEFDRRAFGADRSELLQALADDACVEPSFRVGKDESLRGYALARRGSKAAYVGPFVAEEAETASSLLDELLGRLGAGPVILDLNVGSPGTELEFAL